jgi:hypothetical protein
LIFIGAYHQKPTVSKIYIFPRFVVARAAGVVVGGSYLFFLANKLTLQKGLQTNNLKNGMFGGAGAV